MFSNWNLIKQLQEWRMPPEVFELESKLKVTEKAEDEDETSRADSEGVLSRLE